MDGPQAFSMPVAVFSYGPNDPRFLVVWTGRTRIRSTGKGVILLRHLKKCTKLDNVETTYLDELYKDLI